MSTTTPDSPPFPTTAPPSISAPLPSLNTAARTAPSGQKEYRNTRYRFSLFFPQELTYTEYDEGNGASTISFESTDSSEGFQIFVVPYGKSQVDRTRFQLDEPSGVVQEPQNISIDGVPGTAFFGNNSTMGDTREVWFIRGGYLFEVTTYKELDAWLAQIMSTWKFL